VSQEFSFPIRIYYEDTDAGGVVFYANYLKYMERARTEWLRSAGFEQDLLAAQQNLVFAVHRVKLDYLKPARFNDLVQVTATIKKEGKASLDFYQEVRRDGTVLCKADIQIVCVDIDEFVPRPIPEDIVSAFNDKGV
jgi:acyl-CoA thioester hydrolase